MKNGNSDKFDMGTDNAYVKGAHWKKLDKRSHRRNASDGMIGLNNNIDDTTNNDNSQLSLNTSNNQSDSLSSNYVVPFVDKTLSLSKLLSSPSNDQGNFAFPYSFGSQSLAWMGNAIDSVDVEIPLAPSLDDFGSPGKKEPPMKKATHRRAHSETLNESFLADFFHTPANKVDNGNALGFTRPDNKGIRPNQNSYKLNSITASQDALEGQLATLGMSIDEHGMAPTLKVSSEDWHEAFQKNSEGSNEYHEIDIFRSHSFDTGGNFQITTEMGFSTDAGDIANYHTLFQKSLPFLPGHSNSSDEKQDEISVGQQNEGMKVLENFEIKTKKISIKEKVMKEKNLTKVAKKSKDKEKEVIVNEIKTTAASAATMITATTTASPTIDLKDKYKDGPVQSSINRSIDNSSISHGYTFNEGEKSISSTIRHNAKDFYDKSGSDDGGNMSDANQQQSLDGSGNNEKYSGRGRYRCGRCGALKTNHKCEFIEADICSTGTQVVADIVCQETRLPFEGDIFKVISNRSSIHEPTVKQNTFNNFGTNDAEQHDLSATTWYRYPNDTMICLPTGSAQDYAAVELLQPTTYSYIDCDGNVAVLAPNQAIHYEPDGTAYIITYDTNVNADVTYNLSGMTINNDGTINTNEMSNEMQPGEQSNPNLSMSYYVQPVVTNNDGIESLEEAVE